MSDRNANGLWAATLLDELARGGVRQIVVSPGSRSTPLVLAAAADGRFRVRVQIDERSAGFLGLGVGKVAARPAAILTTSGTAVANLLPAVVEAAQSETPLLLLTADRPVHLRGADANQTIQQVGIFGSYVRRFEELPQADGGAAALRHLRSVVSRSIQAALGDPPGPVHLNVPLAKPLEPEPETEYRLELRGREGDRPWTLVEPLRAVPPAGVVEEVAEAVERARRPIFVAGILKRPRESGAAIRSAAKALGVPLLADALSGARYPSEADEADGAAEAAEAADGALDGADAASPPPGSEAPPVVGGYDIALANPEVADRLRPDLVIRFGAAPTSAALNAWLAALDGVPHVLVDGGGRWKDHAGTATRYVVSDAPELADRLVSAVGRTSVEGGWVATWRRVEEAVRGAVRERTADRGFEGAVVARIFERVDVEDLIFVSNSMPVRDLDAFVPTAGAERRVLGNRGASGIDGIVSTAAGASAEAGRRVVAIVGDLALLHDSNGLASLRDPDVRVLIVVINNDGGGIFHMLPVRAFEPPFTRLFATPHGRDLRLLAELHGLRFARADARPVELSAADPGGEAGVLEGETREGRAEPGTSFARALDAAWSIAAGWTGSGILEVRTDRDENHRRRGCAIREAAASAAKALD